MASCEKCWGDAYMRTLSSPMKSQAEHYYEILEERKHNPCTKKQQAGQFWDEENNIDKRFKKQL